MAKPKRKIVKEKNEQIEVKGKTKTKRPKGKSKVDEGKISLAIRESQVLTKISERGRKKWPKVITENHHEENQRKKGKELKSRNIKLRERKNSHGGHNLKGEKENMNMGPVPALAASRRKRLSGTAAEAGDVKRKKILDLKPPNHSRKGGVLLSVGQNDVGQLGLGDNVTERRRPAVVDIQNVVDVVAGGMHTMCLTSDAKVYTFGCNDQGALGRDTSEEGSEFVPGMVELPGRVNMICAGDSHSAALLIDGRVFVWGTFRDSRGPMGLIQPATVGKPDFQVEPTQILAHIAVVKIASGTDHLVMLTRDGSLFTCGCAEQGQLGRVAECFSSRDGRRGIAPLLHPGPVFLKRLHGKETVFDDVWTGAYSTYARAQNSGDIYVSGLNNYHQLGLEDIVNRYVFERSTKFSKRQWQQISGGQHHTIALDAAGQVYVIGRHDYGRLGLGDETNDSVSSPTCVPTLADVNCVTISAGEITSHAVSDDGVLYSWGFGTNLALGTGDEEDRHAPIRVTGNQLVERKVIAASGGGQHCVMVAVPALAANDENA